MFFIGFVVGCCTFFLAQRFVAHVKNRRNAIVYETPEEMRSKIHVVKDDAA